MKKLLLYQADNRLEVALSLYCISEKDRVPEFVPFIQEVGRSDANSKKKIIKFFETLAHEPDHIRKNEQKYEKMKGVDDIYELKPTGQIRFFAFYDTDQSLCITHGYIKKVNDSDKKHKAEIERAIRTKAAYNNASHAE